MSQNKNERKRKTVTLSDEMGEFLLGLKEKTAEGTTKRLGKRAAKKTLNLLACWKEVASERVQQHTDNVVYSTKSEETSLLVYVDTAAYAAELSMDKELYRIKMQEVLGKDIKDITFLVSRRRNTSKPSYN